MSVVFNRRASVDHGWRSVHAGALRVLPVLLLFALIQGPPASAHSLTFRPAQTASPCVGAGASAQRTLYDDIPVSNANWAIRVNIGLSGGDITQFVWYDWFVLDNAIVAEVARARASVFYWVQVGADIEAHTLTAHIGGTADVVVTINNLDSQSQCFNLLARAAHW